MNNKSVAFVGSVVPIRWLLDNCIKNDIRHIYTASENLKASYIHLLKMLNIDEYRVSLHALSVNKRYQAFQLFYILLISKIRNNSVFIFHEAGWPLLDLLIFIIKPSGNYVPRTNVLHFKLVNIREEAINALNEIGVLSFLHKYFINKFWIYKYYEDGSFNTMAYILKAKKYPKSIIENIESLQNKYFNKNKNRKILFLTGTDSADTFELKETYLRICKIALDNNWMVSIKDHPNPAFRINFNSENVKIYDPTYPADLLVESYEIAVGSCSTALAYFNKSISILQLLKSMPPDIKESKKRYLLSLSSKIQILYDENEINMLLS